MARTRDPGYDDQRERILAQAAQLFAQRGYAGTSMNEVAEACGVSKATLYHYLRDKHDLLVQIAEGHVSRLEVIAHEVEQQYAEPKARLRELITRFMQEYTVAQNAQRVLTEDVRFLNEQDRERILGGERRVVAAFARAIVQLRGHSAEKTGSQAPEHGKAPPQALGVPLTMLLFGMMNWMFTWLKPDGVLTYTNMAPVVSDLFFDGVLAVHYPPDTLPPQEVLSQP
ncbi:MAG: TetR family transcriptional regulator [Burkholderiales bacterium]